jgi:hypothetical protein
MLSVSEMIANSYQSLFLMWLAVSVAGALIVASIDGVFDGRKLLLPHRAIPQH